MIASAAGSAAGASAVSVAAGASAAGASAAGASAGASGAETPHAVMERTIAAVKTTDKNLLFIFYLPNCKRKCLAFFVP